MIHLDTHVVVWLAAGESHRIPPKLLQRLDEDSLRISPMIQVELKLLHEIGRISHEPDVVLAELRRALALTIDGTDFGAVAAIAASSRVSFTRDPFDRIIAAQAIAADADLATKDRRLRNGLACATWE